jgi:hypothetical protein
MTQSVCSRRRSGSRPVPGGDYTSSTMPNERAALRRTMRSPEAVFPGATVR